MKSRNLVEIPGTDTDQKKYESQVPLKSIEDTPALLNQIQLLLNEDFTNPKLDWKQLEQIHEDPKSIRNLWIGTFEHSGTKAVFNPGIVVKENETLDVVGPIIPVAKMPTAVFNSKYFEFSRRIVLRGYYVDGNSELVKVRDAINAMQSGELQTVPEQEVEEGGQ